jgi:dCMP deaminase
MKVDEFGRPEWDTFFMTLAFLISQRSIDAHTKHGTVVVSPDNTILSVGYNGPPRGCLDCNIPLERPDKYMYMAHSEENAIANAARHGIRLKDSIFYITGMPCTACFRKIINVGASKIIYGPISSNCVDEKSVEAINIMRVGNDIQMIEYDKDVSAISSLLFQTEKYCDEKTK